MEVVARDGIEPPTPAFSGLAATTIKYFKTKSLTAVGVPRIGFQLQPNATIGSFRFAHHLLVAVGLL
jgi:hypothetical protein